jgi:GNAT superfamily N-acetyltransferase
VTIGGTSEHSALAAQIATKSDLDKVTDTLWAAFCGDPLWTWAFPNPRELKVWWRFLINSSLRYPWVWFTGAYAAAAVWIPPDGTELTEEEEQSVEPLLNDLAGSRAVPLMQLLARFEESHPRERSHYYLSLLGTHPDHRGRGLGMALLSENLSRIDDEKMPAYLESSNPDNVPRYERLGFTRVGEFSTPDGSHTVTTMWREGR